MSKPIIVKLQNILTGEEEIPVILSDDEISVGEAIFLSAVIDEALDFILNLDLGEDLWL